MTKKEQIKHDIMGIIQTSNTLAITDQVEGGIKFGYNINNQYQDYQIVDLNKLADFLAKYIEIKEGKCPSCGK